MTFIHVNQRGFLTLQALPHCQSLKCVISIIFGSLLKVSLLARDKPPVIDGLVPNPSEIYDLDDVTKCRLLNVSFKTYLPVADEYDHYPSCRWAVIEYKSRSLRNSVEQLESTARQLVDAQKKVDLAIVVAMKINEKEKDIYRKKGNILYIKKTNTPVSVPTGNNRVVVNIYEPHEIDRQYHEYNRSLSKWQS